MTPTRPEKIATALLRGMSTPDLLRHAYVLTHKAHDADLADLRDLRAQRDLIDAEILRRAGERS